LAIALLAGCATPNILLVHPKSGDMVECSSIGTDIGVMLANNYVDACAKRYEKLALSLPPVSPMNSARS
jgi:hypothetical protein